MAKLPTTAFNETPEDLFHDYHLDLQEHMQNPIAVHAEMMGDIMYYDQAHHYHHFFKHVRKGLIKIFLIDIKDQIADALTKPLAQNDFQPHRCLMCGK
jgi:hypothetical protein